jgi:hypothetical protein
LSLTFCLALPRDLDAELGLEFATLNASHQRCTVANRVAHLGAAHASGEFVEDLLSLVRVEVLELSSQRLSLCFCYGLWKVKITTTTDARIRS